MLRIAARILLAFVVIAFGCKPKEVSFQELSRYASDPENGLRQSARVGDVLVEVQLRPTDLWVKQELGDSPSDSERVRSLREKYARYDYFVVSLSKDGREALLPHGGIDQYSELVQTLSFRMGEYITLTTNKGDTVSVSDTYLTRTYGMGQSTDFLVAFSSKERMGCHWIQFNLNEFGLGIGNQRFRFLVHDLEKVPNINFLTSR